MTLTDHLKSFGFTSGDLKQLEDHGISMDRLHQQIAYYTHGFPVLDIDRPAAINDGVLCLDGSSKDKFERLYATRSKDLTIAKFVPASGAASRMFQDLFGLMQGNYQVDADIFFDQLPQFAFYQELQRLAERSGRTLEGRIKSSEHSWVLTSILEELNFQNLPKALIPFHKYPDGARTAFDEHLVEAVEYASTGQMVLMHFTVSDAHLPTFSNHLQKIKPGFQQKYQLDFQVEFSVQHPATDMVAASLENTLFRDSSDNILIRPGGHGALLENLNQVEADLVYIKNVDNVTPEHAQGPMVRYKKVLGGLLLYHQEKIFQFLRDIEARDESLNLSEIIRYVEANLGFRFGPEMSLLNSHQQTEILYHTLNRPLRVCSVIKTDQTTGGGPYWVRSEKNHLSLQIIENAQLNELHSHFESQYAHITDLVCGIKNFKGESFNLSDFADLDTGFITQKSYQGASLRAQEWPGLWNGSMADWNTLLLEVPEAIYHPVKTMWDLLTEYHQPA